MNTNRDSFDVRIDDDLFEVIVSYLPIKDKLRYESVSKRFQRFVFNKQKIFKVIWREDSVNNLKELFNDYYKIDVSILTVLLKKMQFIDTLEIDSFSGQILETITKYCNHLTTFQIDVKNLGSEALKKFCRKFGQQLRHISFNNYDVEEQVLRDLLRHLPNVSSISYIAFRLISSELCLEKLVKLDVISFVSRIIEYLIREIIRFELPVHSFQYVWRKLSFNRYYIRVFEEFESFQNERYL